MLAENSLGGGIRPVERWITIEKKIDKNKNKNKNGGRIARNHLCLSVLQNGADRKIEGLSYNERRRGQKKKEGKKERKRKGKENSVDRKIKGLLRRV